ncbi:ABC transporter permease, partial [Brevibacillus sp. MCWH]|nr:ABC transporter permease [Brevibacillus sp. MCWH]
MRNLAKRVIFQTLNDKRSVALILIAPLLILTLVYFLLGD